MGSTCFECAYLHQFLENVLVKRFLYHILYIRNFKRKYLQHVANGTKFDTFGTIDLSKMKA